MSGLPKFTTAMGLATLLAGTASAQPIGTFTWQMQPFCNRVTLTLTSVPTGFTADGFDDRCGAAVRAGVLGNGVFNPDGSVGITATVVSAPDAAPVHVVAIVSPTTGQGTWTDSVGNSGGFVLAGSATGLPVRPMPPGALGVTDVAENPRLASNPCDPAVGATLVLCGTATAQWRSGTPELPGLQLWRDAGGLVHMRGSIAYSAYADYREQPILILPPELRPMRTLALPVTVGTLVAPHGPFGEGLLVVEGRTSPTPGVVRFRGGPIFGESRALYVGEISYRVDR